MFFLGLTGKVIRQLEKGPRNLYPLVKALLKGFGYAVIYKVTKKNVRIGLPFYVYSSLKISGPGSVFIDKGCSVHHTTVLDGMTVATLSKDAEVCIGKRCHIAGLTIRCHKKVTIGENTISANCLMQDVMFAETSSLQGKMELLSAEPISVGHDVWLASQTIILGGSQIGNGSVVSLGSVCHRYTLPDDHLAMGNPAMRSISINGVENLRG